MKVPRIRNYAENIWKKTAALLKSRRFWIRNLAAMAAFTALTAAALRAHMEMTEERAAQAELAASVIRFRVLADSDRQKDQEVKLAVRDALLERMGDLLQGAETAEDTRRLLEENLDTLRQEAEMAVRREGSGVPVSLELTRDEFPLRVYGDLRFPAGEYETLRVTLGSGSGRNWWCLLFPSLCFQDALRPVLSGEGERKLKYVLSDETYDRILQKEKVSIGFLWF